MVITVVQVNAQCYPDRHSTSWYDGWISCETSANPNTLYGDTHWILYDLGYDYVLKDTQLWNTNVPDQLDYGINEYHIDYSLDGTTWINLGTFNLTQASGRSIYEGEEGPDFNEAKARYVLITPISNYGGDCFGFSELKINITDPFEVIDDEDGFNALVYPNPFVQDVTLRLATLNYDAALNYTLHDILGRQILENSIEVSQDQETYTLNLNGRALATGIYILNIEQGDHSRSFKLIKRED